MKILIIGNGGREHALAWKFLQDDPHVTLLAAPGNAGLAALARCVPIKADDLDGLLSLARGERPDLTVVGPEGALAAGIVDQFRMAGFAIFGPTQGAAQIETSKRFAKELMFHSGVPTARASHHSTVPSAKRAAAEFGAPVVIKASGLAAGKGVVIAETLSQAERAIDAILRDGTFGAAGSELLVEEYMEGEELSVFAICDGDRALMMKGVQDHKRLEDGDRGPNTGGMGAYAPVSLDTAELRDTVLHQIFEPTLEGLKRVGTPFTGLLYAGLMLTKSGPRVVEFNCRFGDPETQALLPLMDGPLLDTLTRVAQRGSLSGASPLTWKPGASVTTIVAAQGYPGTAKTGDAITFPTPETDVYVFHAGTRLGDDSVLTAGGRVLSITGVGGTLAKAVDRSQSYARRVQFHGKQMRHDIAWRELQRSR